MLSDNFMSPQPKRSQINFVNQSLDQFKSKNINTLSGSVSPRQIYIPRASWCTAIGQSDTQHQTCHFTPNNMNQKNKNTDSTMFQNETLRNLHSRF